nr:histidine kinase [Ardenticatena sp.]
MVYWHSNETDQDPLAAEWAKHFAHSPAQGAWWALWWTEETALRVARFVSDGPGQLLANATFEVNACLQLLDTAPDVARSGLEALRDELRQGLHAVQALVNGLYPRMLFELGLHAALRSFQETVAGQTDVEIAWENTLPPRRYSALFEVVAFRIVQEIVFAVLYWADASSLQIRLHEKRSDVYMTFEDDGEPMALTLDFDTEPNMRALALLSAWERVRLLGGTMQIENGTPRGTRVLVQVPTMPREEG